MTPPPPPPQSEAQVEYNKRSELTVELYMARYGAWERIGSKPHRKVESVILNGSQVGAAPAAARGRALTLAWGPLARASPRALVRRPRRS